MLDVVTEAPRLDETVTDRGAGLIATTIENLPPPKEDMAILSMAGLAALGGTEVSNVMNRKTFIDHLQS